jgi:signal transduction histidine kinase
LALLEDTTARDRELRRQREDVLRLLSHDMRAPQCSILALLDGSDADRIDPKIGARIRGYARRTLELADGFVNLSRAQLLEFTPRLLDLAELARDAADALWPQARARGLRIAVTTPEEAEVLVAGEASLLARMLINLADNAIKYADPEGAVTLEVSAAGANAAVRVTNHGPDIPEAEIAELFERFARAPGQDGRTEGVGLGLAFVATVAARHGGTVSCRSGGGTTVFTVMLPRTNDPAAQ